VNVSKIVVTKKSSVQKLLSLGEVQLFNNGTQVSIKHGKASQSSTFDSNSGAAKAIDGGLKFNTQSKSASVTKLGTNHWWKVLGLNVSATQIVIKNNTDGLAHLDGSILTVYDDNNKVILEQKLSSNRTQTYSLV